MLATSLLSLAGIPGWSHLHPMVVHFPVALLMVAPLFVLGGVFLEGKKARPYFLSGLLLMLLGTCGSFLAGATGDAASEAGNNTPAIKAVLEQHEELAEMTQIMFGVLTAVFAGFMFVPGLFRKELSWPVMRTVVVLFLVVYLGGMGVLANTAHQGGRLVHELGIHNGAGGGTTVSTAQTQPDRD